jgi:carboxymethylenebutenolidase
MDGVRRRPLPDPRAPAGPRLRDDRAFRVHDGHIGRSAAAGSRGNAVDDELIPLPSPGVPLAFGEAGAPLVVVVHDGYGRLPWLEPFAEALSQRCGFRVLVPDLYDGVATVDDAEAARLMARLDVGVATSAIDDAIATGRGEGASRVGLVGFALGGRLALRHAQSGAADAVAAYSAALGAAEHTLLPCPVLLNLAEVDEWPAGDRPDAFVSALRDHGTPVTVHTSPGTRHAFFNANLPDRVDGPAAALAFARTAVFLEQHLVD